MKVGRWKVLGLAGVLVLGYVATSEAAQIKVSDETWANFGLNMKIWYKNKGKLGDSSTNATLRNWTQNEFSVGNTKIYFAGQVNKLVQFYGEFDQEKDSTLAEAGVNFAFAKEFQVLAGLIRKSFTKSDLASGYAFLVPTGYFFNPQATGGVTPIFTYDGNADGGLMVHGDLAGGVLTYRVGAYNNDKRSQTNKGFEWNARVEFQPLMLGFKPDSAATITAKTADTYLGKKDVFVIGLGYMSAKRKESALNKDVTVKGWTADLTVEKKYGNLVPNLQIGYVDLDDTHKDVLLAKTRGSSAWYVQGQLLFDQVVGFGKPALAIRFDTTENDKKLKVSGQAKDAKLDHWGVALNYYIKDQAARVSLGFDTAKYKDGSSDVLKAGNFKRSVTDWYLYIQTMF